LVRHGPAEARGQSKACGPRILSGWDGGPDFNVFLRKQYDDNSRIIREAGIKPE
jgi:hypothetical protein